ncbi:hypothetical protein DMN91_002215, partial [Ooceraea biroi]
RLGLSESASTCACALRCASASASRVHHTAKRQKFTGTLKRHRDTENNHDDDYDHDNENVDKRDGQQRAISILAVAADSPGFSEKSGARGCTGVQEAARGTGGPAGACDQDATEEWHSCINCISRSSKTQLRYRGFICLRTSNVPSRECGTVLETK